jgi:desulfoferrodoxin (superoxide reductase-like protein)
MTNAQNRKRWAIDQHKRARAHFAVGEQSRRSEKLLVLEWCNMFFGYAWSHVLHAQA